MVWINNLDVKRRKTTSKQRQTSCEEAKQVLFDGGSIIHLILWVKRSGVRIQD